MEERVKFVHQWRRGESSLAEQCRQYGVSRKTAYKWLERYQEQGLAGLQDRSRAPHEHPNQVSGAVLETVLEERARHPRWGPKKLRVVLQRRHPKTPWPAVSTLGELLKRAGLTVPRKRRKWVPEYAAELHSTERPNQVWCADYKGYFHCLDQMRCNPLTRTDHYSRYLLRCQSVADMGYGYARALYEAAFREYGLPEAMRHDNGSPFASVGLAGLSELSVWLILLGIRPERIRPGRPQENGRHERMHRSLKEEAAEPPQANLRAQQKAFDRFRQDYNQLRPHEALGMKTPAEVYRPSPRQYPKRIVEPEYESGAIVRVVGSCGRIRWNGERVFISKALGNQPIRLEPGADGLWKL